MKKHANPEIPADEFTGKGGAYELRDGKRVLVEEPTRMPPHPSEEPPPATPAKSKKE